MITVRGQFAFFDSPKVVKSVDRMRQRQLARAGGMVRTTSKRSIRKRKKPSLPGNPPHSHTGDLRKIFFGYDKSNDSVIVGPLGFKNSKAPQALEHGGYVMLRRRDKKTGELVIKPVLIRKRAYMQPALETVAPQIPGLFKNKLRR